MNKFKILIKSPLHIGSGEVWSRFSDFAYKRGEIFILDKSKLLESVPPEKIKELCIDFFDKNEKEQKKFIEKILPNSYDFKHKAKRIIVCNENPKAREINRNIHTSGQPYIPGSSVKGAISTAIIYDFLKTTEIGNSFIKEIEVKFNNQKDNFKNIVENKIIPLEKKITDNKIRKKDFNKQINSIFEECHKKLGFDNIHEFVFGKPQNSFMKLFQITDVYFDKKDITEVGEIKRGKGKQKFPIMIEYIKEDVIGSFSVVIKNDKISQIQKEKIQNAEYFKKYSDVNKIFEVCNDFYNSNAMIFPDKTLSRLRVGKYKSFFDQSMLNFFKEDVQMMMRELYRLGENPSTKKLGREKFPSTYSTINNKKLGWCAILPKDYEEKLDVSGLSQKFKVTKK